MFRNYALLSGLVTQDQIQQAVESLRNNPDGPPAPLVEIDDNDLAAQLVQLHILTQYQADQIKAGRTKLNLGPYTITDFIGQGGMGQVFKAVHQLLGRESAVKVLPLSKATPEAINNFMREIRMQAKLDHPNLVRANDAGRDGDVHYLVTEYVPGTDLRKLIRSRGPLTQQQAASIVMQAARGLHYAHEQGLIHRDVKPGNILVTPEGVAKVSDLGLAGFIHGTEYDPRAGKIVGTADYLSPEQIRTPGEVTPVSDIYSLGCTLYYAVCGKVPFPGGTARDKARRHCDETPWHPRRFSAELHEEFIEIVADMMEKDPAQRIGTAAEVAARLEQFAGDAPLIPNSVRSPWKAGPLPSGEEEPKPELPQESEALEQSASSPSQMTHSIAAAGHETLPMRPGVRPIPLGTVVPASVDWTHVMITLMIAVPISMLLGAVLATVMMWMLR